MDVADHVGEEVHLEIAQALVDVVARADQRGNDDQRARRCRHAVLEFVADQPRSASEKCSTSLLKRLRPASIAGSTSSTSISGDRRVRQADIAERGRDHRQQDRGDGDGRTGNARPAGLAVGALEAACERRLVADRRLQLAAMPADQEEADVGRVGVGRRPPALAWAIACSATAYSVISEPRASSSISAR